MKRRKALTRERRAVRHAVPENRLSLRKNLRHAVLPAARTNRQSPKKSPPLAVLRAVPVNRLSLRKNLRHAVLRAEQAESNPFGDYSGR